VAEYEFNFVATNSFRNYSLMTLTGHHTNEISLLEFTTPLCSALNGRGGHQNDYPPHELAAQSLPIAVMPTRRHAVQI